MSGPERVVENLNRGLREALETDERVLLLGEDLLDPYGGAFKVTKGLSTDHPDRVVATPLCEGGFVGAATGLALCGDKPIVEIMFGDFAALAFDPILNLAAKSVSMYGRRLSLDLVIRCPVGGNRGYGPTHSQSLQKHFLGIPDLALYEVSAFHDNAALIRRLVGLGHPSILFEDKVLYAQRMVPEGRVDELFDCTLVGPEGGDAWAVVSSAEFRSVDWVIIAGGGAAGRCVQAARSLFVEHEIECEVLVPSRIYPFDFAPVRERLRRASRVAVAEEGVAGGTWGSEVATALHRELWDDLQGPVVGVHSSDGVVPAARHLETRALLQADDVYAALARETRRA